MSVQIVTDGSGPITVCPITIIKPRVEVSETEDWSFTAPITIIKPVEIVTISDDEDDCAAPPNSPVRGPVDMASLNTQELRAALRVERDSAIRGCLRSCLREREFQKTRRARTFKTPAAVCRCKKCSRCKANAELERRNKFIRTWFKN